MDQDILISHVVRLARFCMLFRLPIVLSRTGRDPGGPGWAA